MRISYVYIAKYSKTLLTCFLVINDVFKQQIVVAEDNGRSKRLEDFVQNVEFF